MAFSPLMPNRVDPPLNVHRAALTLHQHSNKGAMLILRTNVIWQAVSGARSFCKRLPSHTGQEQACTRITWLFVRLFVRHRSSLDQERGIIGPASLLHCFVLELPFLSTGYITIIPRATNFPLGPLGYFRTFSSISDRFSSARNENLRPLLNTNIPLNSGKYGLRNHFWPLESVFFMRKKEKKGPNFLGEVLPIFRLTLLVGIDFT